MRIAMVGLGRMGLNMTLRLLSRGHRVVAYDLSASQVGKARRAGAEATASLEDCVRRLKPPRVVWLMLPAGGPVEARIKELSRILSPGDLVVDGGNSDYKDASRRAEALSARGLRYMDVGVSGGIWGRRFGYCLMAGGDRASFRLLEPVLRSLAPRDGYLHCGGHGAGHFLKMVHNGIEYGMMQAYAEGFEILDASPFRPSPAKVARLWNKGSVIRSWLLELAAEAFDEDEGLEGISGFVPDSGEGRWTVHQAVDAGVAAPVITLALYQRFLSRTKDSFSNRVLAALRRKFGGHPARPARRGK